MGPPVIVGWRISAGGAAYRSGSHTTRLSTRLTMRVVVNGANSPPAHARRMM